MQLCSQQDSTVLSWKIIQERRKGYNDLGHNSMAIARHFLCNLADGEVRPLRLYLDMEFVQDGRPEKITISDIENARVGTVISEAEFTSLFST